MTPAARASETTQPATAADGFRSVFEAEFAWMHRTLRRLGVQDRDLEDVTQEVFVSVHRRFGDYRADSPARPWLFSFARRAAANYRRLARHEREIAGDGLRDDLGCMGAPGDPANDAHARDLVVRALDALDFDRRTIFVMHDLDGFAAPEIAAQLGIPLNTAYSRLRLARGDFQAAVRRLRAGEGGRS